MRERAGQGGEGKEGEGAEGSIEEWGEGEEGKERAEREEGWGSFIVIGAAELPLLSLPSSCSAQTPGSGWR